MPLHKTPLARGALTDRSGGLSAFERRILILSDGQRDRAALVAILGAKAEAGVDRLLAGGYLEAHARVETAGDPERRTGNPLEGARKLFAGVAALRRDDIPAPRAYPTTSATPTATAAHTANTPPRRSLAATKMYVLDMLQLQRHPDAHPLRMQVQRCTDPQLLVEAVLEALAFLFRSTPPSYSQRVFARVAEIVPEDALPALRARFVASGSAAA